MSKTRKRRFFIDMNRNLITMETPVKMLKHTKALFVAIVLFGGAVSLSLFPFFAEATFSSKELVATEAFCIDGGVRINFELRNVPSSVTEFPNLSYILNGEERTAQYDLRDGSTVYFTEFIPGAGSGSYTVSEASFSADGYEVHLSNAETFIVSCETSLCTLSIEKVVDKTDAVVGDTLTYTITVKNEGDADCTGDGVKVKDIVDANLEYISETHSSGVDAGYNGIPLYTPSTRTLVWDANILNPGETVKITWKGNVKEQVSCGAFEINNVAQTTSLEYANFAEWVESNEVTTGVSHDCAPPELFLACEVSPSVASLGTTVTYRALVSGGSGSYSYSWSGTDGLSGTASTVSKVYVTAGTKTGFVEVTSGSETKIAGCEISVTEPPPTFSASCVASPSSIEVGESIIWSAIASGGTGFYSYSWSGTDGLSGSTATVTKTYTTTGVKTSTVTIMSGSASTSAMCEGVVTNPSGGGNPLKAACTVLSGATKINTPVTYGAVVSGGTGSYTYDWTGSEGLSGNTETVTKSYNSYGSQTASVTVTSGSETVTSALCSINLIPDPGCIGCGGGFNPPEVVLLKEAGTSTLASFMYLTQQTFTPRVQGVYLSEIPYTGVTGTVAIIIFIIVVILWSVAVAYFIESDRFGFAGLMSRFRFRKGVKDGGAGRGFVPAPNVLSHDDVPVKAYEGDATEGESDDFLDTTAVSHEDVTTNRVNSNHMNAQWNGNAPGNLPTADVPEVGVPQTVRDAIFNRARERKALISEEAGKAIAKAAGNSINGALGLLDGAIARAEEKYLKEDGWILLNRDKVNVYLKEKGVRVSTDAEENPSSLKSFAPLSHNVTRPQNVREVIAERATEYVHTDSRENNHSTRNERPVATVGSAVNFLKAVSSGDTKSVMDAVRSIKSSGGSLEDFASDLILELDRAYRARLENDPSLADPEISRVVAPWGARDLEEVIAILFSIAQKEYQSESTGLKLVALRLGRMRR